MTESPTPRQILDLPLQGHCAAGCTTIRDYLIRLLADLWAQGSDFSSKRPFGGSDWQFVVYEQLVKAGWVAGKLDDEGHLDDVNVPAADQLINAAIKSLGAS